MQFLTAQYIEISNFQFNFAYIDLIMIPQPKIHAGIRLRAAEYVEAPKMQQTEAQYMNDEQARAFLSALLKEPDIRIKTALMLDLFTGMRRGELCGLSWGDIDFDENTIHVRRASQYIKDKGVVEVPTKNKSSVRDITVTAFVTELLKNYRTWWLEQKEIYGDEWLGVDERLFIKEKGEPIFPDTINRWLHKFTEHNGLPPIHPHTLRHTFITLQITSGVDVRTLQSRTGHSQASTLLDTYAHTFKSAQKRAAQAMDDALFGNK
jgi:integrase